MPLLSTPIQLAWMVKEIRQLAQLGEILFTIRASRPIDLVQIELKPFAPHELEGAMKNLDVPSGTFPSPILSCRGNRSRIMATRAAARGFSVPASRTHTWTVAFPSSPPTGPAAANKAAAKAAMGHQLHR